jgi:ribosomal protein L12E/L44/L45/RPP1/RPP2
MVINTATIAKKKVTLQEIVQNQIVVVESLMNYTAKEIEIVDAGIGVLHTQGVRHIRVVGVEEETVKAVVKKVEGQEVEEMTADVTADAQIAEIEEEVQAEISTEGGHHEVEKEETVEADQEMKEDQIVDAAIHVVEVEAMTGETGTTQEHLKVLQKTLYVTIVKKGVIMLTIVQKKNKNQSAIIVKSQVTWHIIALTQESNELLSVTIVTKKATWREIVQKREDKHAIIKEEKYLMEKEMDVRADPVHVILVLVHLDQNQA